MVKRLILVAAVLALMCAPVMADDDKSMMNGEKGMQMPEMGPPKELKELAFLVGTWKGDFLMKPDPSADFTSIPATYVFTTFMEDCGYQGDFSSNFMGMPFNGQWRLMFNRETSKWQEVWVDNMGANMTFMEGTKEGKKFSFTGTAVMMGVSTMMRETTTFVSDTEFTWSMQTSVDGGKTWDESMKATYKKQ